LANITTQQLAELIIGIARSQQAIVDALESQKAGFKGNHLAPALDNAAKSRVTTRPLTLQEVPSRVLLQCMGRNGPNIEQLTRDLDALLGQSGGGATASESAQSLDMTQTPNP
jgi:hypothetical protein